MTTVFDAHVGNEQVEVPLKTKGCEQQSHLHEDGLRGIVETLRQEVSALQASCPGLLIREASASLSLYSNFKIRHLFT